MAVFCEAIGTAVEDSRTGDEMDTDSFRLDLKERREDFFRVLRDEEEVAWVVEYA